MSTVLEVPQPAEPATPISPPEPVTPAVPQEPIVPADPTPDREAPTVPDDPGEDSPGGLAFATSMAQGAKLARFDP
jgi:hypothetical protein